MGNRERLCIRTASVSEGTQEIPACRALWPELCSLTLAILLQLLPGISPDPGQRKTGVRGPPHTPAPTAARPIGQLPPLVMRPS